MKKLAGKTALVTVASRGIGQAIAERLAADGAAVAGHYGSRTEAAKETTLGLERTGGQAFALHAELGVEGDLDTLFTALDERLAGAPLNRSAS